MGRTVFEGGRAYFPSVKQIRYEGPGSDNPLAFKVYEADRVVAGKTMEEHLRFAVVLLAHVLRRRARPVRPGHARLPVGREGATRWPQAKDAARRRVRVLHASSACRYYCFHDRDLAPEGEDVGRVRANLRAHGRAGEGAPEGHGRAAAVGHGQPVLASALHERRGARTRTSRWWRTPRPRSRRRSTRRWRSAARTTCSGAAARATATLCEHRHEARARELRALPDGWPATTRRSHRLQGRLPHRAEADGADEAPVRLATRRP